MTPETDDLTPRGRPNQPPLPELPPHMLELLLEGCQVVGFDWRYLYLNDTASMHGRVAKADLIGDCKWTGYLEYCDRFYWAVPPHLAEICGSERFLPDSAGLIVADRYDAAIVRDAADRPLAPARRKAELLRFARRAARRLSAQIDPTLGEGQ